MGGQGRSRPAQIVKPKSHWQTIDSVGSLPEAAIPVVSAQRSAERSGKDIRIWLRVDILGEVLFHAVRQEGGHRHGALARLALGRSFPGLAGVESLSLDFDPNG